MNNLPSPPPPSFLSGLLAPAGMNPLKERFRKEKITDYDANSFRSDRGKTPSERMRELDNFNLHTPLPEEVELLNVTPYRMNLLSTQDVLYLCGGLVGVRFSSADLMDVLSHTKGMTASWNELSSVYKAMSAACKKMVLSSVPTADTCEIGKPESDEHIVRRFHNEADRYVTLFEELQSLIREKQKLIDPNTRTDMPKLDADPESRQGRKMPEWLSVLIEKHYRTKNADAPATSPVDRSAASSQAQDVSPRDSVGPDGKISNAPVAGLRSSSVRVGELAVFLSGCVVGHAQCSEAEAEALAILVQASNDTVMNVSNADIHAVSEETAATGGHNGGAVASNHNSTSNGSSSLLAGSLGGARCSGGTPRSRRYWARRFYNFLSSLTELAAAIKDEGALDTV